MNASLIATALMSLGLVLAGFLLGRNSERSIRCPHCECSCPEDCPKCKGVR